MLGYLGVGLGYSNRVTSFHDMITLHLDLHLPDYCYLFQFSTQLATIGSSNRIIHKLLLQLLASPPPSHAHPMPSTDIPSTPTSRVSRGTPPIQEEHPPRINLRVFGSYYTITYLFLLLLVIWLLSVPLIMVVFLLLLSVFTYCIMKYCVGSGNKDN